jgi:hypothetical protein
MKKILLLLLTAIAIIACSSEDKNTMYVKGSIKGLKKGVFYLQKQKDSLIVSVDSVSVNGSSEFMMTDIIESPEMYFLTLGSSSKRIPFFGETDTITITSQLDRFEQKAVIRGSENQDLLNEFNEIQKKFNGQRLDLIKEEFEIRKLENQDSLDLLNQKYKNWERKKYLYTTNFAVQNADFEVSPYIALTELMNANIKLLDTVNNSLTEEVRLSKYGKQLDDFIKQIKEQEK